MKLNVLAVGVCAGTRELLERRVGGILGQLAWVRATTPERVSVHEPRPDLIVTLAHGALAEGVRQQIDPGRTDLVTVELTLLPAAVVSLSRLPSERPIGVVCHHRGCANTFLAEIIRSGVVHHRFASGGFDEMAAIDAACFICPEDVAREARAAAGGRTVVPAPRGVSPYSAAELIQTVLTLRKARQRTGAPDQKGARTRQDLAGGRRI